MKYFKFTALIGLMLIAMGAALLFFEAGSENRVAANTLQTSARTEAPVPAPLTPAVITGNPTRLDIPSLGISLDIIPGYYDSITKTWTLTKDKVQYATNTVAPNNESGNTFIYGHNRKGVFSTLRDIPTGAVAIVTTDNNRKFYYLLDNIRVTNPTDDSLFYYQGKPILTIQTCSGAYYQDRQLFTFNLQRVV